MEDLRGSEEVKESVSVIETNSVREENIHLESNQEGFDSSSLKAEARNNLGDLARVLADDSDDYQLLVAGHTDSVGREGYNQSLSERRAQAAADFLLGRGMSSGQVRTQGLGESEPVASNETEAGQEDNRRVEVAIFASEEYRDEAVRRAGS